MIRPLFTLLLLTTSLFAKEKPNLVFIVIDDAGYDDFGYMGGKDWKTPNIDSIAKNGVNFTSGYVTASVCGPSRAGLITGRYQQSFGHEENVTGGLSKPVPKEKFGLPVEIPTLGTLLQKQGYVTSAFGKWHLGEHENFHPNKRGFDHFVGFLGGHRSFFPLQKAHHGHQLMINDKTSKTPEYLTDHLGKEAVKFIETNKDKPFFVYLAYNAVHSPLEATEEDLKSLEHITDKKRQVLGAMTIALDRSIGNVLDSIKKQGLEENTIVVFSNDNGAATYLKTNNGGLRGRKGTVWEGGLRVPYCVSWKGHIKPGTICDTPVNTLDVAYTFCKQAGYYGADFDKMKLAGTDLLELVEGKQTDRALYWRRGNTSAIRQGDWKLITTNGEPAFMFNITADIKEANNLLESSPEKAKQLFSKLQTWDKTLPTPLWTKKASNSYHKQLLKYWDKK